MLMQRKNKLDEQPNPPPPSLSYSTKFGKLDISTYHERLL